jgi:hypothetical protein
MSLARTGAVMEFEKLPTPLKVVVVIATLILGVGFIVAFIMSFIHRAFFE